MIVDTLTQVIQQNIGTLKSAPKGWFKRDCMLCHTQGHGRDKRKRFGIQFNSNKIVCHCFNCGFTASYAEGEDLSKSFKLFLRQIAVDEKFIKQLEFEIFKHRNYIKTLREGDQESTLADRVRSMMQKWKPVDLPKDSYSLRFWLENNLDDPDFMSVVSYAISRGIYDIDNFYWSPQKYHNLNQRLIIPYFYKQKIVGFTARLFYDTPDKSIPKYYQQCPQDFVYNLDHQQSHERKYLIVTEGVLDGWTVDGVSTLGEIGQDKIDIINRLGKEVIVCPDRDKKGGDLVRAAIDNNWMVSFPKWEPGIKDASKAAEKYGRLLTLKSIIDSAVSGKEKIEIKWKLDQHARERQRNK